MMTSKIFKFKLIPPKRKSKYLQNETERNIFPRNKKITYYTLRAKIQKKYFSGGGNL